MAASSAHCRPSAAPLPRVACLSAAHFVHLNRLPAATAHSCWAPLVLAAVSEGGSEKEHTQAMERLRYGAARLLAPCAHDHARGLAASALGRRYSVCMANAKFCLWWSLPQWCKCGSAHRPIRARWAALCSKALLEEARVPLSLVKERLQTILLKRSSVDVRAAPRLLYVARCMLWDSSERPYHLSKCGPSCGCQSSARDTLMLM